MSLPSSHDYAGDLDASEAWAVLEGEPKAQLIDVRTLAEWNFVGVPDLAPLGRRAHCIEWQQFPSMASNPDFVAEAKTAIAEAGASHDTPLLLLCRSGARSRAAAKAFNIADGFEGGLDDERHRGLVGGWKASGLPWKQS